MYFTAENAENAEKRLFFVVKVKDNIRKGKGTHAKL